MQKLKKLKKNWKNSKEKKNLKEMIRLSPEGIVCFFFWPYLTLFMELKKTFKNL